MKVLKVPLSQLEDFKTNRDENIMTDYVKLLTDAGIEDAETIVTKITTKVTEHCKGESEAFINAAIDTKIKQYLSRPKGDKFTGVFVALSEVKDSNKFAKDKAINTYNENPSAALRKKLVMVQGGEVIPLDDKKFFDKAGKTPNPNFGKPIKTRMSRSALLLTEDKKLIWAYGDFQAVTGSMVTLTGAYNKDKNIINVNTDGCKVGEPVPPEDIWKTLFEAGKKSDLGIPLEKIFDQKNSTAFMTTGVVAVSRETSNNGAMIRLSDENIDDELTVFSDSEDAKEAMLDVSTGNQVIVIGRVKSYVNKRGDDVFNAIATGVIVNPESSGFADKLSGIDIDDI